MMMKKKYFRKLDEKAVCLMAYWLFQWFGNMSNRNQKNHTFLPSLRSCVAAQRPAHSWNFSLVLFCSLLSIDAASSSSIRIAQYTLLCTDFYLESIASKMEEKTQLICKIAPLLLSCLVLFRIVLHVCMCVHTQRARHSNVKNDATNQLASYIQMKEKEEETQTK